MSEGKAAAGGLDDNRLLFLKAAQDLPQIWNMAENSLVIDNREASLERKNSMHLGTAQC